MSYLIGTERVNIHIWNRHVDGVNAFDLKEREKIELTVFISTVQKKVSSFLGKKKDERRIPA